MASTSTIPVAVALTDEDRQAAFAEDVRAGLGAPRKQLPSKWLYDDRGSRLFEAITELPEYYPTRTERGILQARAGDIATLSGAETVVELGSGTSTKTRLLIEALHRAGTLRRFVAFDMAEDTLRRSLPVLADDYPCVDVAGVVGDFEAHLAELPAHPHRLVAFLGGTIGNLEAAPRKSFLTELAARLEVGEQLLLGADLVKDPSRLVAAYDDPGRVTEAFEKNALAVVNRTFGACFDLDRFAYRAVWSEIDERIEMGLVSRGAQDVAVPGLDLVVHLDDGEEVRTEISAKFRLDALAGELAEAGLPVAGHWTDPAGDFAVLLAVRADQ